MNKPAGSELGTFGGYDVVNGGPGWEKYIIDPQSESRVCLAVYCQDLGVIHPSHPSQPRHIT